MPSHRDFSLHTNFSRTPSTLHFYSIPHYSIFYTFVSTTPPLRPGARAAWHHSQDPRQGSGGVFLSLQAWRCPFSLPTMEFIVEVWAAAFSTPNNSSKRVGEWWRCGVRIVCCLQQRTSKNQTHSKIYVVHSILVPHPRRGHSTA